MKNGMHEHGILTFLGLGLGVLGNPKKKLGRSTNWAMNPLLYFCNDKLE